MRKKIASPPTHFTFLFFLFICAPLFFRFIRVVLQLESGPFGVCAVLCQLGYHQKLFSLFSLYSVGDWEKKVFGCGLPFVFSSSLAIHEIRNWFFFAPHAILCGDGPQSCQRTDFSQISLGFHELLLKAWDSNAISSRPSSSFIRWIRGKVVRL